MFGELSFKGYATTGVLGVMLLFLIRGALMHGGTPFRWKRTKRRLSRAVPLAFAGLAMLVFLGGVLYQPSNYDGLTYRVPRVLHWLADQQWHWIHTVNYRMNDRSCGFEWLMAPLYLVTHSDRAFFLINFVPFLLMPGLVFSVFSRLGVSARMSWYWMWLLPTGYSFLLQAGSIGNDAFAAVYALAAVDLALRASATRRLEDAWLSLLAAALLTGAKPGNLPLLLPWFILFVPHVPRLICRPVVGLGVVLAATLASFIPTALLNVIYCGDWSGLVLEKPEIAMQHPLVGIAGNSAMFLISNFVPPIFPMAGWWNHHVMSFLPGKIAAVAQANFESTFCNLGEIPTEEWAGLGFGLSSLLLATMWAAWFRCRQSHSPVQSPSQHRLDLARKLVLASPYLSLLVFFAKSGMMTVSRLVAAYYPLLIPALVRGPTVGGLVRCRWWRGWVLGVMVLAFMVVILTPARPLWPVKAFFSAIGDFGASHPFATRVKTVYSVYADRPDPLALVREALPEDCTIVGFAGSCNDTEISFWRPFGRRRVEDILAGDSWQQIRARHIRYAVVAESFLSDNHLNLQAWLKLHRANLLNSVKATLLVSNGPQVWHVVRFDFDEPTRLRPLQTGNP